MFNDRFYTELPSSTHVLRALAACTDWMNCHSVSSTCLRSRYTKEVTQGFYQRESDLKEKSNPEISGRAKNPIISDTCYYFIAEYHTRRHCITSVALRNVNSDTLHARTHSRPIKCERRVSVKETRKWKLRELGCFRDLAWTDPRLFWVNDFLYTEDLRSQTRPLYASFNVRTTQVKWK